MSANERIDDSKYTASSNGICRAAMLRIFSLIATDDCLNNPTLVLDPLKENATVGGEMNSNLAEHIFKHKILTAFMTTCGVVPTCELLKACFKQYMCSSSAPDRLFPSLFLQGNAANDSRDRLPPFEPFTPM